MDEARILIDHMPASRGAAYHLEQAAEKIIRAITTSEDIRAGLGHELDDFVDEIPDTHPFKMECRGVQDLKKYATSYRYPTSRGKPVKLPTKIEFEDNYSKVKQLLEDVANRFQVDLDQENAPAGKPDPIR